MSVQQNPSACRHPLSWEIMTCLTNESRGAIQKPSSHNSAARRVQGPTGAHKLPGKRRTLAMACKFSMPSACFFMVLCKLDIPSRTSGPSFLSGLVAALSYLSGSPIGKGSVCRARGSGLVVVWDLQQKLKTPILAASTNISFKGFAIVKMFPSI